MKRILAIAMVVLLGVGIFVIGTAASPDNLATDVVLMALTRTGSYEVPDGANQFNADSGLFAAVSNLTAWNNNAQIAIGDPGNARAPIAIHNANVVGNAVGDNGFRSVGPMPIDDDVTVDTATAFQIRFETTDHENIRFTARQRSTGSGPQYFALAYRVGSAGSFTAIAGTETGNVQSPSGFRDNAYTDFDFPGANTFTAFVLPAAVEDQAVVYLRVYMVNSTLADRTNGNTSINNIVIIGDEMADDLVTTTAEDTTTTVGDTTTTAEDTTTTAEDTTTTTTTSAAETTAAETTTQANHPPAPYGPNWLSIFGVIGVVLLSIINTIASFRFVRIMLGL
ncbi:MAG: hypothetical protein FWB76_03275 [Oscillospiraceae bacterium]|nr:hypothetical protein [Oscillospiraceae bacterium]